MSFTLEEGEMKRKFRIIAAVSLMTLLAGCLLIGCLDTGKLDTVAIRSAARVAGYTLAQENPALATVALPQAQTLLAAADGDEVQFTEILFPAAVALLQKNVDDPLIAASIADLIGIIEADGLSTGIRADMMKVAVQGFTEGLMMAGAETATGK